MPAPAAVPIPDGSSFRAVLTRRPPLEGNDVTQLRTGIAHAGREYHCRGTIAELGTPDARRYEFVLHGPDAAHDDRALVAWFIDFEEAVRAAPRIASAWVDTYTATETA